MVSSGMCQQKWAIDGGPADVELAGLFRVAWHSMASLSEEDARERYVALVAQSFPGWQPDDAKRHSEGALAGPVFSSLANSTDCGADLSAAAVCAIHGRLNCRVLICAI